ncbi:GGDEF domain-containing protein [Streptomyces sp. CT34]|uniref:GGDEF domain-containing protein n=1 Tax=Streptomyces sp. CT34 TaxID=1553907 RepID=UPI00068C01A6|nr:GGDEF domain-containing protein [Streptomyces sp. CT34]
MYEAILAAAIPAAGWVAHAALLHRRLNAERHDPISGLWDRRTWMRRADRLIRQRRVNTVILCDLDGFKPVNDTFGHDAGDAALKATGARLADYIEHHGGAHTVCSRLGGDEFAVAATTNDLETFTSGLARALAQPVPWPGGPLKFTASVGAIRIADLPQPSASTALGAADVRMYEVKGRGRRGRRTLPRRLSALLTGRAV